MPTETHKLQEEPPEGSRETVEHELRRQRKKPSKEHEEKKSDPKPSEGDR